ncbi:alpha-L-fucosidase [Sphingobacterium detergens]|uniref:alpha-L-fucosidase n=1 Tax=Sphingobacterium detergens TaxID=1145106 RepID=A0A420B6V3_SPHD1|nr:alpha-L-fucosidase [Sphingobacterium detergens]RKE52378.1 alpha-L-fucosidase [Sphingobacterium detergens]
MIKIRYCLILMLSTAVTMVMGQVQNVNKGNEAADMFNDPSTRDRNAISAAEAGWWKESVVGQEQRIKKWKEASFGMFVHWGIYSQYGNIWKGKKGGGYAEHLMRVMQIPRQEYLESATRFNPEKFNAEEWVILAKNAGMKYFIITAKHHDGFAMYPSQYASAYSTKSTAFKRDPMAELAKACHKHGLLFGFYYSHAFDWEDPNAPGNDWDYRNPGGDKLLGGANWFDNHPEWLPKAKRYVDEKAIPQIQELIHKYQPDLLWFDTPHKLPLSENLRILKAIRDADPRIVVNGRLARTEGRNYGDYLNTADRPEEFYPVSNGAYWEAIPTTNDSYGYSSTDMTHKPTAHFIQLLAKAKAMGGNILLNIGPKGDGSFDEPDVTILEGIAAWMAKNKESVIDVEPSPLPRQQWGVITKRKNILYLHVFNRPKGEQLTVGGLTAGVRSISLLSSKKSIKGYNSDAVGLHIPLDQIAADAADEVIVVQLKQDIAAPESNDLIYVDAQVTENRLLSFYAKQYGDPMKFGDGKRDRYYVSGWKNRNQYLGWNINVLEPARFNVSVRYVKDVGNTGGDMVLKIGGKAFDFSIDPSSPTSGRGNSIRLGQIDLPLGKQSVELLAKNIVGGEAVKFLEVVLTHD